MLHGKTRKWIALLLAAVTACTLLAGCGNKEKPTADATGQTKGRYVESTVTMPEGVNAGNIVNTFKKDGNLHLLTKKDNGGMAQLQEWEYKDGTFTEVTGEWMKQVTISYYQYGQTKLLYGKDGTVYLFAVCTENDDTRGHLFLSKDGATSEEITPESWTIPDEQFDFIYPPENIVLLDNGTIVGQFFWKTEYYSAEDGSKIKDAVLEGHYSGTMASLGDQFYLLEEGDGTQTKLNIFNTTSEQPVKSIPFKQNIASTSFIDVLEDGSIIICGVDGFYRCAKDDDNWEKLIDGLDTSMALSTIWGKGMTATEDGSFYVYYGGDDDGDAVLMKYAYDPEAVSEVTQTIKIFSVYENSLIKQAAVMFHKMHPEVAIEVEYAVSTMEKYGSPDYNQIYQNLNTKLMAGEGADILIMDKIDADIFIDKGLLVDINDVVSPLEEDNTLLSNITGHYLGEDGSRYIVPLQFSMALVVGRDVDVHQMADVPSLAMGLSQYNESLMGTFTPGELTERFLPYFSESIIEGKELNKEALKENLEYLKAIADNSGIVLSRGEEDRALGIWDIASKARLVINEANGFNGAMFAVSAANLVNGDFVPFGNAFFPKFEAGINAKTEYLDTAKEFLAYLLCEDLQKHDFYEGFPVNSKALDTLSVKDRSNAEAYTTITMSDGTEAEFAIKSYDEKDAKKLTDACRSVTVKASLDNKILEEISYNIPGYLDGSQSMDETISKIEAGLQMYLAE